MAENVAVPGGLDAATAMAAKPVEPSILNALPHFLPLGIFPLILIAAIHGGWWIAAPFVFFMLAGPLDVALGVDERSMDPLKTPESRLFWHNLPVWFWAFLWPPILVFCLWQILVADHLSIWECVLMAVILAGEAQAVFIVGHELIHRRSLWERRLGEFLLASVSYPQYATEHIYIHHAFVGTPMDAGSAPKGESIWRYFPREVASNFTGAWRVTRERLARRRLSAWHYSNPLWRYGIETALWYALVYWMGGPWAIPVFAILCLGVVFSMKVSNYIQHYGLRRVRLPNGRFEKVRPRHSWSANCKFSNWMFYNMQRHPDHHAVASRHFPLLQHHGADESPQLPGSYVKMFNLAVRPRKWFATMDPRVDQWRAHFYPEIDDWSAYDSPVSAARPEAFDAIVEIFGAAPRLAGWIERNPELLDSLDDREFTDLDLPKGFGPDPAAEAIARCGLTRLYWTREFGVAEMVAQIAEIPIQDVRDLVETVRNWSNDKAFQIGMHTLRGNLSPVEAGTALSSLAEASITAVLSAVVEEFAGGRGQRGNGSVAAVVLGDLASGEAAPGIELDVLFVHAGDSGGDNETLCRRFRRALRDLARDSLVFAPNPRGGQGRAVRSLAGFAEYTRTDASTGELLELTRARCIFETGEPGIGQRFDTARREVLADGAARDALTAELREAAEDGTEPGLSPVDVLRRGFLDVERAARLLQLVHAADGPDDPAPDTASVFRTAATSGWISDSAAERLAEPATLWRMLQGALRLVAEEGVEINSLSARAKALLAQACGLVDFDALAAAAGDTVARAAAEIVALEGMGGSPAGGGSASASPEPS